jgi:hypothetical protein
VATIIELFGIPGSGKTTYRAHLAEWLRAGGLEVVDPGPPPKTEGRFQPLRSVADALERVGLFLSNRRLILWCMNVLRRSPRTHGQKIAAFRFVFVTLERYRMYQRDASDRIYIIDEGSLQRLFLLLVERDGARTDVDRRAYIDAAPFGDLLVHVQTSPEECLARLAGRDRHLSPRLLGLDDRQAQLRLAQGEALLAEAAAEAVAALVTNRPKRRLARFSNPGPPARGSRAG